MNRPIIHLTGTLDVASFFYQGSHKRVNVVNISPLYNRNKKKTTEVYRSICRLDLFIVKFLL